MTTPSFTKLATVTASTKRNPDAVSGKVGAPEANLTSLAIWPLMPVNAEIVNLYRLDSPRESFVTYAQGSPDVLEGDVMTVSSTEYRVRSVGEWPCDEAYLEIILERIKGV